MFSVCKARQARQKWWINKLLRNILVTSSPKTTKNQVTKISLTSRTNVCQTVVGITNINQFHKFFCWSNSWRIFSIWSHCALYNLLLVQASGLEHLIKDDISNTGKNKFDIVRIGGRCQMRINWPFFQINLTLAQKSVDYEVGGFCHIIFTLKLRRKVI